MKQVPLNELKDDLSKFLRMAETEDVVITRHGKPAGYLVGFEDEDDWIDYQMLRDPKFQERMRRSLQDVREGRLIPFEALKGSADAEVSYRATRGKAKAQRVAESNQAATLTVDLDPDIAGVFKTPEAVKTLLRALIETMPRQL